jgi:hypothetical protein
MFKAMLDSESKWSSSENEVCIPDISSKALRYLIQFLYTGSLNFVAENAELGVELLSAANRFMLPRMAFIVENGLIASLGNHNALGLLKASLQYDASLLREASSRHVLENYEILSVQDTNFHHLLLLLDYAAQPRQ